MILGACRVMHSEVLVTKKARINRNHQALYTAFRLIAMNSWAQNGPNWFT